MSSSKSDISIKDILLKLSEIWKFLISKWKLITFCVILGGFLGLTYSILKHKKYQGNLSFVLEEESKDGAMGLASLASNFGIGSIGNNSGLFSTSNMLEFLKTKTLIQKTLLSNIDEAKNKKRTFAQLYFDTYKLSENETFKGIEFKINEDRTKFSRLKDSVLNMIYTNLVKDELTVAQPNDENSFVLITIRNENELFSKRFPEKLIEIVSDYYIKSKTKKGKNNVDVLQKQVDSVRRELYNSMSGAASATDNVFGLNPSMNVQRVPAIKKQVDVQANTAILSELVKNLEISKMSLMQDTPFIEVVDAPIYPLEVVKTRKSIGIIVGALIFGFFIVSFLLIKRYIKKINS